MDVDLESSAMTNTLPVHRLGLQRARADAPAAYVRALTLTTGRLDQVYGRISDEAARRRYDYAAPAFGFTACLVYDDSGLVVDYPGIAIVKTCGSTSRPGTLLESGHDACHVLFIS